MPGWGSNLSPATSQISSNAELLDFLADLKMMLRSSSFVQVKVLNTNFGNIVATLRPPLVVPSTESIASGL